MGDPECHACSDVAAGRGEICMAHGLMRVSQEEIKELVRELERRRQTVVKRYVVESYEPRVETIPVSISEKSYLALESIRTQLNSKDFDSVIRKITQDYAVRFDPQKTFESSRPLIINGVPGSGKTTLCKGLIKNSERVFVVDVSDEYIDYEVVSWNAVMNPELWKSPHKMRVIPDRNPMFSDLQMTFIFQFLMVAMREGLLKDYVIAVEEAHRFRQNLSFQSLVAEARKFIKKLIIVCTDPTAYSGMGEVIKP